MWFQLTPQSCHLRASLAPAPGFLHESPDVDPAVLCLFRCMWQLELWRTYTPWGEFWPREVVQRFFSSLLQEEDAETEFI